MPLSQITKETVSKFFSKLSSEGKSAQYQKNMYGLVNLLFQLAWTFDLIPVSPVAPLLHRPSVERGEKQTLPIDMAVKFFEALDAEWRAPLAVLCMTGMRQGELLGLRWSNIDFKQKLITKTHVVYRGELTPGLKTTSKHVVGMSPLIEHIVAQHKEHSPFNQSDCYVFCRADGRPLDPDHVRRYVIYPALTKAGIPQQKRGSGLHMFRHTAASALVERTGDISGAQHQLGHSSIQTTANVYTHVNVGQKLASANALEASFPKLATFLLPPILPLSLNPL
jgi:integrase